MIGMLNCGFLFIGTCNCYFYPSVFNENQTYPFSMFAIKRCTEVGGYQTVCQSIRDRLIKS